MICLTISFKQRVYDPCPHNYTTTTRKKYIKNLVEYSKLFTVILATFTPHLLPCSLVRVRTNCIDLSKKKSRGGRF